ncbi:DNA photolyase [Tribonema minus]|uniref:DNA photolyase n=1 Tax=Tribonema minus TaxID=303371 RepID=A0A835Z8B1_9STRA|nr:DNA photolyase [Tribonema minus]
MTTAIHWFRKGLRLHDNPALLQAAKEAQQVYPVFMLDPHFANPAKVGQLRYAFLLETLSDLDTQLKGIGSRLYVVQGNPAERFPELFREWSVSLLTFETDTEPYAKKRDQEVCKIAETCGVTVAQHASHTLHNLDRYEAKAGASPLPKSYGPFLKLFDSLGAVPQCVETVTVDIMPQDGSAVPAGEHTVPSLDTTPYPPLANPLLYPGGETAALARMQLHLARKQWIAKFEKPKTSPNSLEPSTTVLSPYLKFGCLSSRLFYHKLAEIYKASPGHAKPPVSLHGQLLWREFFYMCGHTVPHFDRMEGNPICRQVPWDSNAQLLAAWEESRTGYPFIDAIMTQLRTEGWIHHLARHAVACFLTRGDLWQSWEAGAVVFDKYLLDADWSVNTANWMWLSCSSFFYQYFRCYSPVAFGKKTDPTGAYIRKYLPQLKNYPDKYIYEPWLAPKAVQEKAGCVVGCDYPKPIVDHKQVSKDNMDRMKAAYAAQAAGSDDDAADTPKKKKPAPKRKPAVKTQGIEAAFKRAKK